MPEVDDRVNNPSAPAEAAGAADIVIGVPTHNNAGTVGQVVRTVQAGLGAYFPASRSVVVNADGGSKDGTAAAAAEASNGSVPLVSIAYPVYTVHKLSGDFPGIPGRGNAFRSIFAESVKLGARACAIVDVDTHQGIAPDWVQALVSPVVERGFDLVVSRYQRYKYEGLMINGLVYPLIRTLFGKRIRQPVGGDFAFSSRLMEHCLKNKIWDGDSTGAGADLRLITEALSGGFHVSEALLGVRALTPREPAPEISDILENVLGALFAEMGRTAAVWQRIRGSEPVPVMGRLPEPALDAASPDVDRMVESFLLGYQNLWEIWTAILSPATLVEVKRLATRPKDRFQLQTPVWVRTVYDFAVAYNVQTLDRHHLLQALTPLYLGWAASFASLLREASPEEAEQHLELLCVAYEEQKNYLISRWRWPDRFNS